MDAIDRKKRAKLTSYQEKRSPDTTPEPFGEAPLHRPGVFVVQKHAARRTHYDLRLEHGGVLMSWAVPQGPSLDPDVKRLAVRTEDHPVDYADFEGIIPKGSYGAGAMIVWDRGLWVPLEDPVPGLESGKLLFELRGFKLHGVWTLVRTRGGRGGGRRGASSAGGRGGAARGGAGAHGEGESNEWLLIKKPDAWAGEQEAEGLEQASIFSGLTVEQLAEGAGPAERIEALLDEWETPRRAVDLRRLKPMLAQVADEPFSRPGWIFELKYDGYRMLAGKAGGRAALRYRSGNDATDVYPELLRAVVGLPCDSVIVDGELAVLDERGMPSFQRLQARSKLHRPLDVGRGSVQQPATLFVFDLLAFEGYDLRSLPLRRRKEALRLLLPPTGPLRYADHVEEQGAALYEQVVAMGLEGLVAKDAEYRYRAGRSGRWLKIRAERQDDFAVVGFTEPKGSRVGFGALHLGVFDDGELVYAGRVGTGFDDRLLEELRAELEAEAVDEPPAAGAPEGDEHVWVEPRLVAEVRYKEWTEESLLRQPVFVRLRDDKTPEECERPASAAISDAEEPDGVEGGEPVEVGGTAGDDDAADGAAGGGAAVEAGAAAAGASDDGGMAGGFGGRSRGGPLGRAADEAAGAALPGTVVGRPQKLSLSNLDKVFWPEEGYTKGDLIEFYRGVADWMVPFLADRPLVLDRYPDGIEGKSFFQKNIPEFVPDWIRTAQVREDDKVTTYVIGEDADTLVWLANLAAIPLHVWSARLADLDRPDWCSLDLDPGEAEFEQVVTVARAVRDLCRDIGLPCYVKTTGKSGLHVLLPLGGQFDHDQAKVLGELLARVVARDNPETATTARLPKSRGRRVYIDYVQNGRGKLLVAPYSVRPVAGATVSTPLRWREVNAKLDPGRFTIASLPRRLARMKDDPLAGVLTDRPDLATALERLSGRLG